jgi:hypothetical protein
MKGQMQNCHPSGQNAVNDAFLCSVSSAGDLNENQGPMKTKSINAGNCSEKRKPIRLLK